MAALGSTLLNTLLNSWKFRIFGGLILLIVLIVIISFLNGPKVGAIVDGLTPPQLPSVQRAEQRVWPEQNWDVGLRNKYHHLTQGTRTLPIPLKWLLALEQPVDSLWSLPFSKKAKFVDNEYILRFGFIEGAVSNKNPHGLPVGFATTPFQSLPGLNDKVTAVGFNCAACHTGHIIYGDTEYIIEGGPATVDLGQFTQGLGAAIGQTLVSSKVPLMGARFKRFANNVLGPDANSDGNLLALAQELENMVALLATLPGEVDVVEGFGRLDALNRIGNQVFALDTNRFENYVAINAPVNFPHIWTSSWFDWVQYDGSIMNPLVRNTGEAMGVSAYVNSIVPKSEKRFSSSVAVDNLLWIERSLGGTDPTKDNAFNGLQSPPWPESLPPIDQQLANKGADLYRQHCQECHLPAPNTDEFWNYFYNITYYDEDGEQRTVEQKLLNVNIIPQAQVGTDPAQGNILTHRTVNTAGIGNGSKSTNTKGMGIDTEVCTLAPQLPDDPYNPSWPEDRSVPPSKDSPSLVTVTIEDGPDISFALALGGIVQQVNDTWFEENYIPEDQQAVYLEGRPNCLQAGQGYKARPLNGVWATAPFLHNGSVPTVFHLLSPPEERPDVFELGDIAFDPQKLGLSYDASNEKKLKKWVRKGKKYSGQGYFLLNTAIAGNSNLGHEFSSRYVDNSQWWNQEEGVVGPELSADERYALIEYLKTL